MKPTRGRTLLLVGVVAVGVTWALLTVVYSKLPPLTWTGVPALLIAAGAEAWTGHDLQARIHGRPGAKPVPPLFVARMVALAKASSLAAALFAGVSAGFVGYLSGMLNATTPRNDLITASVSFGSSLVLLAAALFLEYCCRVPKNPNQDKDDEPAPPRPSPFHN
ncbi:DUF3180 domain-containing protein [Trebonia sp.]|uniref:DUF3180 domain-containing protein n=1 Tax=Trebonia sp. TaxID=2767075 RepID=UPI00260564D7|nr:DUF3180 domain-containing protein [Trebonia sp.]